MIEISFGKLLLLALIALIVLGPEKLPGAARTAGALVRRLRNGWDSVRSEVERELEIEDIRRTAREATAQAESIKTQMRDAVKQVNDMARGVSDSVQREAEEITTQIKSAAIAQGPGDLAADLATDAQQQMSGPALGAQAASMHEFIPGKHMGQDTPDDPRQAELALADNGERTAYERAADPAMPEDHPDAAGTLRRAPYGKPLVRRQGAKSALQNKLEQRTPAELGGAPANDDGRDALRSEKTHGDT